MNMFPFAVIFTPCINMHDLIYLYRDAEQVKCFNEIENVKPQMKPPQYFYKSIKLWQVTTDSRPGTHQKYHK